MQKFTCDICGLDVAQYKLVTLHTNYCPKDMEHACPDCYAEINTASKKISEALNGVKSSWMRKVVDKIVRRKSESV